LEESLAAAKKNLAEAVEEAEDLRALGEDKDESLEAVEALAEQLAEEKQDLQNTVAELQLLSNNSAASDAGADISEPASVSVLEKDLAECRGVRLELEGRIVELEEEMARQKSKFDAAKMRLPHHLKMVNIRMVARPRSIKNQISTKHKQDSLSPSSKCRCWPKKWRSPAGPRRRHLAQ